MSKKEEAASKNAVSKEEIRRMMKLTSAKMKSQGRMAAPSGESSGLNSDSSESVKSHPFARYNSLNQLTCILCGCPVKSSLLWRSHLASKQHRANADALRQQGQDNAVGILTGEGIKRRQKAAASTASICDDDEEEEEERGGAKKLKNSSGSALPSNFFDRSRKRQPEQKRKQPTAEQKMESSGKTAEAGATTALPEGFFDDPYADAKARQVPYKDKMEEEIELFTRQIRDTEVESEQIVEADEEEAETVRRLDEIIAQEETWHRLNELELMKEAAAKKEALEIKKEEGGSDASDVSDSELDLAQDAFSWRKKQL